MARYWRLFGFWIIFGVVALLQGGCGPTTYARAGVLGGGYRDKSEATPDTFEVIFLGQGRSENFVKNAAYYRSAEVTYNNSYHYFRVLKTDDSSMYNYSPNMGLGSATQTCIPGITLHIQCFAQRPAVACYDAYDYLNKVKLPGTELPYPVNQRQADKMAGKYNP